jgi:hypothetical protein
MRLLYVDINAQFHNPTRVLVPLLLAQAGSLTCFGPGYVCSATLSKGLEAFLEETGPYDAILTNSHVIFADISAAPLGPEQFRKWYTFAFPGQDVLMLPEFARVIERLTLPRVGIFLESDYYNWTAKEIERLDRRLDVVIGFGAQFMTFRQNLPNLEKESFAKFANDVWAGYAAENTGKIANQLHFVSDADFCFAPLNLRLHAWSIMGANYHARRTARHVLSSHGIDALSETPIRKVSGLAKKVRLLNRELCSLVNYLNRDFRRKLASSRYSYTCGSGLRMPIRKFFEIPAAGAVLACQPFTGFSEAGFRDGVNAVVCDPKDIVDVHRMLVGDPDRAQRIASAGRQLVASQHSIGARAGQFQKILDAAISRTFAGAHWRDGQFEVRHTKT